MKSVYSIIFQRKLEQVAIPEKQVTNPDVQTADPGYDRLEDDIFNDSTGENSSKQEHTDSPVNSRENKRIKN